MRGKKWDEWTKYNICMYLRAVVEKTRLVTMPTSERKMVVSHHHRINGIQLLAAKQISFH